ncbi:hypothetical protein RRG08_059565 [Elysia crispata]|uniref:Uncharacterized protein n=1 Tax=Elysia crispata TaxID=231223 RepID=A0AAE1AVK8_9GAST|nr:hypothetical protein RRG08_059565 [Elysia crispata]
MRSKVAPFLDFPELVLVTWRHRGKSWTRDGVDDREEKDRRKALVSIRKDSYRYFTRSRVKKVGIGNFFPSQLIANHQDWPKLLLRNSDHITRSEYSTRVCHRELPPSPWDAVYLPDLLQLSFHVALDLALRLPPAVGSVNNEMFVAAKAFTAVLEQA